MADIFVFWHSFSVPPIKNHTIFFATFTLICFFLLTEFSFWAHYHRIITINEIKYVLRHLLCDLEKENERHATLGHARKTNITHWRTISSSTLTNVEQQIDEFLKTYQIKVKWKQFIFYIQKFLPSTGIDSIKIYRFLYIEHKQWKCFASFWRCIGLSTAKKQLAMLREYVLRWYFVVLAARG